MCPGWHNTVQHKGVKETMHHHPYWEATLHSRRHDDRGKISALRFVLKELISVVSNDIHNTFEITMWTQRIDPQFQVSIFWNPTKYHPLGFVRICTSQQYFWSLFVLMLMLWWRARMGWCTDSSPIYITERRTPKLKKTHRNTNSSNWYYIKVRVVGRGMERNLAVSRSNCRLINRPLAR